MAAGEDPDSEREQAIVRALHRAAVTERAPARLRERLEQRRPEQRRPERSRSRLAVLPALGSRAWSGVAAALVAAVVAAVVLIPGGAGTPSVAAAAALGGKAATLTAPGSDPLARYLLTARVENLHFPNWEEQRQGWVAVGARTDRLGNRHVATVFYKHGKQTIAYSIVATPELESTGRRTFMQDGRTVFSWRQDGHTCVLSGKGVSAAALRALVEQTDARGEQTGG